MLKRNAKRAIDASTAYPNFRRELKVVRFRPCSVQLHATVVERIKSLRAMQGTGVRFSPVAHLHNMWYKASTKRWCNHCSKKFDCWSSCSKEDIEKKLNEVEFSYMEIDSIAQTIGTLPYSHNIVSSHLRSIAKTCSNSVANRTIDKLHLKDYGFDKEPETK